VGRRATLTAAGTLPNFLIIGALRSGTTSLARYLGAHPDVFMASQKEVRYFDRHFERGLDWYRRQFSKATTQSAVGEGTPAYMYEEVAISRMEAIVPDARLIAILRNPVDRAYSHYWLNRARGSETLEFAAALEAEESRLGRDGPRYAYAGQGSYLRYLQRVCDHFPRASLFTVVFEDLRNDPAQTYRSVCRFLDIDAGFLPENLGRPMNRYVTFHSTRLRRLTRGLPPSIRSAVGRLNVREAASYPPMDPDLRQRLLQRFERDNAALASWLEHDLEVWQR
jgi:sulfotransferase family protein